MAAQDTCSNPTATETDSLSPVKVSSFSHDDTVTKTDGGSAGDNVTAPTEPSSHDNRTLGNDGKVDGRNHGDNLGETPKNEEANMKAKPSNSGSAGDNVTPAEGSSSSHDNRTLENDGKVDGRSHGGNLEETPKNEEANMKAKPSNSGSAGDDVTTPTEVSSSSHDNRTLENDGQVDGRSHGGNLGETPKKEEANMKAKPSNSGSAGDDVTTPTEVSSSSHDNRTLENDGKVDGRSHGGNLGETLKKEEANVKAKPSNGRGTSPPQNINKQKDITRQQRALQHGGKIEEQKKNIEDIGPTMQETTEAPAIEMKKSIWTGTVSYLIAGAIFVAVVASLGQYLSQSELPPQKDDVGVRFLRQMDKVETQFPNQRPELWKRSRIHLRRHLQTAQPTEPVSLILAAGLRAEKTLHCLARGLASAFSSALNVSVLHIDGASKASQDSDQVKLDIDNKLKGAFEGNKPVAVIHRLEELPPGSTLIFYRYCDHENAAYKNTFLIFTVLLGEEEEIPDKIRLNVVEEMVDDHLRKKFLSYGRPVSFDKMDLDKYGGLWSRISHLILPVAAEKRIEHEGCQGT
ncbi:torsin-1A-interacting protein 2-like isoform X2 [Trachinotus anak]|uniref:torsin-1A-interacting protein 2-like isoform X2 n=1 Tax=Trachinotus anak TaxID=443729 RepID=UPI0039F202F3